MAVQRVRVKTISQVLRLASLERRIVSRAGAGFLIFGEITLQTAFGGFPKTPEPCCWLRRSYPTALPQRSEVHTSGLVLPPSTTFKNLIHPGYALVTAWAQSRSGCALEPASASRSPR